MENRKPRLVVLSGGAGKVEEGPVTRLGLRDRFPSLNTTELTIIMLTKFALVISFLYYLYG